jgi:hypothetical protein
VSVGKKENDMAELSKILIIKNLKDIHMKLLLSPDFSKFNSVKLNENFRDFNRIEYNDLTCSQKSEEESRVYCKLVQSYIYNL